MKPPALILRPSAFKAATPAVMATLKRRFALPPPGPGKGSFQLRPQSVLEYLVGTLRKTW